MSSSKRSEVIKVGQRLEVAGESDTVGPEVRIRLDETLKSRLKSKKSRVSDAWQAPNMIASYSHKNFENASVRKEEDNDDCILQSDMPTRKLLKRKGTNQRMANEDLLALSAILGGGGSCHHRTYVSRRPERSRVTWFRTGPLSRLQPL